MLHYTTKIVKETGVGRRSAYPAARPDFLPTAYVVLTRETASSRRNSMAKLTKRIVDAAEARDKDHVIWDDELLGFGLRVFTSGKRSYLIQYRSVGRSRRYTIGQHGVWTPELARREAKVQLGRVAKGDNPAEEPNSITRQSPLRSYATSISMI
jgi:hypothetical protein